MREELVSFTHRVGAERIPAGWKWTLHLLRVGWRVSCREIESIEAGTACLLRLPISIRLFFTEAYKQGGMRVMCQFLCQSRRLTWLVWSPFAVILVILGMAINRLPEGVFD